MFRKTAIAAALLYLAVSPRVQALGLGEIDLQSALNQPLNAVVELTSANDAELDEIRVNIASRADFDRAGIIKSSLVNEFRFSVERTSSGQPVIRISSQQPVRDVFLEFLLEVGWSKGRLVRAYTVLVDPPVTMPARPIVPRAPVTRAPQPAVLSPPPVASRPVEQPVREPAPWPVAQSRPAPAPAPARRPSPAVQAEQAAQYGPVRRNETLWVIAQRLRPDQSISTQQMMIALQRANPQAFGNNNINNLRAGAELRIPDINEITSLSRAQAINESRRQYEEWRAGRQAVKQQARKESPAPAQAAPVAKARLQLVAPEEAVVEGAAAPGIPKAVVEETTRANNELRQQLVLATEESEAGRAQSRELQSRLSQLEEQMANMQRLLELKDEQLASMQSRLSGAPPAITAEEAAMSVDEDMAAAEPESEEEAAGEADVATAVSAQGEQPQGYLDKIMNNPVLAGLGVLVAMLLGGFLWASTRKKKEESLFGDELAAQTPAPEEHGQPQDRRQGGSNAQNAATATASVIAGAVTASDMSLLQGEGDSDPLTEADVFLAYGRTQQAEEVLANALQTHPNDNELKVKMLEVYHTTGNAAAFDSYAEKLLGSVAEDSPLWKKVVEMGRDLSPANELYAGAAEELAGDEFNIDFDAGLADADEPELQVKPVHEAVNEELGFDLGEGQRTAAGSIPETIEYTLDEEVPGTAAEESAGLEEEVVEDLLFDADEVGTKLDLARAYLDMGDPEGARSILEEVMEEGNENQKHEAETLFSQLA